MRALASFALEMFLILTKTRDRISDGGPYKLGEKRPTAGNHDRIIQTATSDVVLEDVKAVLSFQQVTYTK
jgi:hypothetical protein